MLILNSFDEFKDIFRSGKKWIRCKEAIENISNIKENRYHSIGDSLVYMFKTENHINEVDFQGHRRYMDIHYYIEGQEALEISKKNDLNIKNSYSDENDTEYFHGDGEIVNLTAGNLIIIENDEAFRFKEAKNLKKVVLKVTIEDNYFLNK
ncbi:MAG: beta-galactosidase subunit beta [Cetobacterium somerae]|uniref:beta-galactosidase subunit beta n=1 Tax=Cetobacterium TaxID=180162 RepID=UPI00163C0B2B|nr:MULTISPECIES: beta-galactosidase subunit beta [Cetobacterium]MBC2853744.1 beta-galactosidase subunit beta [Cetobacterium sp. 2G large]